MTNTILEAVGLLLALAAFGCFTAAAWSVSWPLGVLVLGGCLLVCAVVLVLAANTRKPGARQ